MNTAKSSHKWGEGQIILTANKRRRISAEAAAAAAAAEEEDRGFDNVDNDHFDDTALEVDEDNPFDSIDRLLNEREQGAEQTSQKNNRLGTEDASLYSEHNVQQDEPLFSQNNDHFSCSSARGREGRDTVNISDKHATNNETDARKHFFRPTVEQNQKTKIPTSKRTKQYHSVVKSSTPRFTFQSTLKKASLQTPAHRQSLPNRNLFDTQTTQKSTKRRQRHSFQKPLDKPPIKDVRDLECTPSFLRGKQSNKKGSPENTKSTISEGGPCSSFASMKSTLINDAKPQSSRNSGKAGYLIQRLQSLRSNDKRMAMRLRKDRFSSSIPKRRRSGHEFPDPKHSAKTVLDVTVSNISCAFGDGRSAVIGYIHRFESMNGGDASNMKVNLPCFVWIILSNDILREQGVSDETTKQLRFYDAVIIPKRVSGDLDLSNAAHNEMILPTIVCGNVCVHYSAEATLPNVSFEKLQQLVKQTHFSSNANDRLPPSHTII
eukprot:scaffold42474_cov73-Cyclotella_meneghiniana.AAC.7